MPRQPMTTCMPRQLVISHQVVEKTPPSERSVGQRDDDLVGDGQSGGLGALGGAGALGLGVAGRPGRRLEGAGGDPRPGLEALEAGDLIFELLDALPLKADLVFELADPILLEADNVEQLPHQRRAFGRRDLGQRDQHGRILPTNRPGRPGLLRSYDVTT